MASLNRVILIGNLGRDPEVKYLPSGQAVANFSIATSERFQNKEGKNEERTEWHRIVVFGKQAENCGEYLSKGRSVCVEGSIRTREWEDKNGQKRNTTEIVAFRVIFLGAKGEGAAKEAVAEEEIVYDKPPKTGPGEDVPF